MAILAVAAGFVSRRERNRLVPVVLFLLPLVLGFLIYPLVGILVAAVEIVLFFSKKREFEREKKEEKPKPRINYTGWGQVVEPEKPASAKPEEKPAASEPAKPEPAKPEPVKPAPQEPSEPKPTSPLDQEEPPPPYSY